MLFNLVTLSYPYLCTSARKLQPIFGRHPKIITLKYKPNDMACKAVMRFDLR